ncbi:N-acetylmuramoyl-L-alanine amidase [Sodalis sp. CWE]|nr:N-acetylmuramoyl-L-alanine amidase [Sodalis sp. CWE]
MLVMLSLSVKNTESTEKNPILIDIINKFNQSIITLKFIQKPMYSFSLVHCPERIMVNIYRSDLILKKRRSAEFNEKKILKCINIRMFHDKKILQLICDLTKESKIFFKTKRVNNHYDLILTIVSRQLSFIKPSLQTSKRISNTKIHKSPKEKRNLFNKKLGIKKPITVMTPLASISTTQNKSKINFKPIIIAIDAGHGGQDPGATTSYGLYEKDVTIAIARNLKTLLKKDFTFKPFLIRNNDFYIPVKRRSDIARQNGARVLISIHVDSAKNHNANGASVWVLSNRRVNNEIVDRLEQCEKRTELLKLEKFSTRDLRTDVYLNQTLLDLQFGYSQRVGYEIGVKILSQLQKVCNLHKYQPEHASLGILRSPDIPSLLIEAGFISNPKEAKKLTNKIYQDKIANAVYLGLRSYFFEHSLRYIPKLKSSTNLSKRVNFDNKNQNVQNNNTFY